MELVQSRIKTRSGPLVEIRGTFTSFDISACQECRYSAALHSSLNCRVEQSAISRGLVRSLRSKPDHQSCSVETDSTHQNQKMDNPSRCQMIGSGGRLPHDLWKIHRAVPRFIPSGAFGILTSCTAPKPRRGLFDSSSHTSVPTNHGGRTWFDSPYRCHFSKGSKCLAYVYSYPEIDFGREPITSEEPPIIELDFSVSLKHGLARVAKFDLPSGPNEFTVWF